MLTEHGADSRSPAAPESGSPEGHAALYRALVQQAPVALAWLDRAGRVREANTAFQQLLGCDAHAATGLVFENLARLADAPGESEPRRERDAPAGPWRFEQQITRPDGQPIRVVCSVSALGEQANSDRGFVAAFAALPGPANPGEDPAAHVETAVRQRDELLATVAHDLKTPLAAIKGRAELLIRRLRRVGPGLVEGLEEGLTQINATATRMAVQLDELIDVARLQGHPRMDLYRQPMDLVALVQRVVEDARHAVADERPIRVETTESSLVGTWAELRIERAIGNLLGNAVKYSPSGSEIAVSVARESDADGRWAVVRVRDQGVGIADTDLPRVFERFYRGGNVAGVPGSGIGLAGARQLVAQHGGSISVESDPGRGSTFTVRLPLDGDSA